MRLKLVLSLFTLLSLSLVSGNDKREANYWWQLELVVSVTGESRYGNEKFGFLESFKTEISGKANFERDNGDYILFPGKQLIEQCAWLERVSQPGKAVQETNLSKKIEPKMVINYAVRRQGKLYIDFEFSSVKVPRMQSFQPQLVFLPRSAENQGVHPQDGYNRGIVKGCNQVVMAEDQIYQREMVEKRFTWQWVKKKGLWRDSHTVNLMVRIKRSNKEK